MKTPETFRCHVQVKGEQCPCEMTLANTFTYAFKTIERKAKETGVEPTVAFLAQHALCPWHSQMFRAFRRDICKMEYTLATTAGLEKARKNQKAKKEYFAAQDRKLQNWELARMPAMKRALIQAGIAG